MLHMYPRQHAVVYTHPPLPCWAYCTFLSEINADIFEALGLLPILCDCSCRTQRTPVWQRVWTQAHVLAYRCVESRVRHTLQRVRRNTGQCKVHSNSSTASSRAVYYAPRLQIQRQACAAPHASGNTSASRDGDTRNITKLIQNICSDQATGTAAAAADRRPFTSPATLQRPELPQLLCYRTRQLEARCLFERGEHLHKCTT